MLSDPHFSQGRPVSGPAGRPGFRHARHTAAIDPMLEPTGPFEMIKIIFLNGPWITESGSQGAVPA
jgi:hypothetical protein